MGSSSSMYFGQLGLQNGANTIMESIIYFHDYMMMILSMILVFVVYFLMNIMLNKYLDKKTLESHSLEVIWTVLPMVILLVMAYPSLMMLYFMEASESSALDYNVKVIAHQWYWEFSMGENSMDSALKNNPGIFYTLEATSVLHLPLNNMINFYITSADVLHSFTVPAFGIKVDACAGRVNTLSCFINLPGSYFGQCSEICGANHSFMPVSVLVK